MLGYKKGFLKYILWKPLSCNVNASFGFSYYLLFSGWLHPFFWCVPWHLLLRSPGRVPLSQEKHRRDMINWCYVKGKLAALEQEVLISKEQKKCIPKKLPQIDTYEYFLFWLIHLGNYNTWLRSWLDHLHVKGDANPGVWCQSQDSNGSFYSIFPL